MRAVSVRCGATGIATCNHVCGRGIICNVAIRTYLPLRTERRSHRRLAYTKAAATVVVSSIILLLPVSMLWQPTAGTNDPLELKLIPVTQKEKQEDIATEVEQFAEELSKELPADETETLLPDPLEQPAPEIDWYGAMHDIVENNDPFAAPSMHAEFDELRRIAKIQFRKSAAPEKKEIWDNVEKDMLGRTLLRAGDCYRVLDDPSVSNQWLQETFGQYMVYCEHYIDGPKELPFVAEIVERYSYLQDTRKMLNLATPVTAEETMP